MGWKYAYRALKFFYITAYEVAWRGVQKDEKPNDGTVTMFLNICQGGPKKCCDSKCLIKTESNNELCPVTLLHEIINHGKEHTAVCF